MGNFSTGNLGSDSADELADDMRILSEGGDDDSSLPDDEKAQPKEKKDPKDLPTEGTDDEDEVEEVVDEKDEDDKEEVEDDKETPEEDKKPRYGRPTVADIKTKYPNFFKDFPDMRHSLFREGEYSSIFPTIDDAKEAQEKVGDYDNLVQLFNSGKQEDFEQFLGGIAKDGSLANVAGNFLPSLYKTNRETYFQITTPIAEALCRNAFRTAEGAGNENLKNAALVLAKWAFGDVKFATGERQSEPPKATAAKDPDLEREKSAFYQEKYNDARAHVDTNGATKLRAEIKNGLDPNGVFKPFTLNLLLKEVMEEVGRELEKDPRHMAMMNSLWKQAHRAGYAGNWKDRLLTTYLSRARAVMPAIRMRIRAEALKGEQHSADETSRIANKSSDRKEVQGGGSSRVGSGTRAPSAREVDWSKTSDMDILNDRPTLRKRG